MTEYTLINDKHYVPRKHSIDTIVGKTVLGIYCHKDSCFTEKIKLRPDEGLYFYFDDDTLIELVSFRINSVGKIKKDTTFETSKIENIDNLLYEKILSVNVENYNRYGRNNYWAASETIKIVTSKGICEIYSSDWDYDYTDYENDMFNISMNFVRIVDDVNEIECVLTNTWVDFYDAGAIK